MKYFFFILIIFCFITKTSNAIRYKNAYYKNTNSSEQVNNNNDKRHNFDNENLNLDITDMQNLAGKELTTEEKTTIVKSLINILKSFVLILEQMLPSDREKIKQT